MGRKRAPVRRTPARCPECGVLEAPASPRGLVAPIALLLGGGLLSHYLVGIPLIATAAVLAVRRDRCRCGEAPIPGAARKR